MGWDMRTTFSVLACVAFCGFVFSLATPALAQNSLVRRWSADELKSGGSKTLLVTATSLKIWVPVTKSVLLPPDFSYDWGGASFQEKRSSGTSVLALGLAAIMVFLILAAQYEKWSLPLSVMMALPFGTFGALAAVWLRGFTNDVYFQIGLVTLLGLAAKNAILIVEYANLKKHEGLSTSASALEAARLRFRPILMTSLAFILGVLPLAISTGAGAGARHSVGTGVMGGMMAATFLAIFFVPLFFRFITDRKLSERRSTAELRTEIEHHNNAMRASVHNPHVTQKMKGERDE